MRAVVTALSVIVTLLGASAAQASSLFYIRGGGYGHGIGMSQYGAYGYALHGKDYRYILGHYYEGTTIGQTDPNQVIRVLLSVGNAAFSGATRVATKKLDASLTYSVRSLASGSLAVFDPHGKKVGSFSSPVHVSGPGPLDLVGHGRYRGAFELRPEGRAIQAVDAVDLEDYVRGVVAAEMPSTWSLEALKAQAVAARTYAITSNVGGTGYQLYSDTRSQAYGGVAAETSATDAALAATRGQVVTYNGQPAITYFFSSSGGHTEDVENVWLGSTPEPWLRGVSDPYDGVASNPNHRWVVGLSMSQATSKLGALVKGKLVGIRVTRWGVSPRIVSAQVVGTRGRADVSGPQLQQMFGLRSTYMAFTNISSSTSSPSIGSGGQSGGAAPGGARLPTHSALAVAAAAFEALPPGPPRLVGDIFPAPARARVAIQVSAHGHWRAVAHARLGAGGAYSVKLSHGGVYRVLWDGLDGPAITVS